MPEEPLQFHTAETVKRSGVVCAACGRALTESYFDVVGHPVCPGCRDGVLASLEEDPLALGKAVGLGLGAALLGAAVWWGVRELSGSTFGLIAVGVGWLVGRAVNKGAAGRGGPKFQALAVGLTYLSVVLTYVPPVVQVLREAGVGEIAPVGLLLFLAKAPFVDAGPIGWMILAFALWEAFRQNRRVALAATGPYQVGAAERPPVA